MLIEAKTSDVVACGRKTKDLWDDTAGYLSMSLLPLELASHNDHCHQIPEATTGAANEERFH